MPKAKPVSLHPLSFDEAVKALIRVESHSQTQSKKKPSILKQKKRKN